MLSADFFSMMTYYSSHTENEVYYYHSVLCGNRAQSHVCLSYAEMQQSVRSKHLGSTAYLTDDSGQVSQVLNYLPYGEPYVDQRTSGYSERFRFTGKERDEETGYGYFGARYMDHELTTMWLSVDLMADKYPGISPYAYCHWNPIKLVDPDGQEDYQVDNNGNITKCKDQSHAVEGKDRLFRGRPRFDKNGQPKKSYVDATEGTFGEYNEETNRGITKYNLNYEDLDDNQVPYSPYEIKINEGSIDASERKATEIFEFLSKNTRVEWTYFGLGSPESDELQSVRITTSRMRGYEPYGFGRARRWKEWVKFAYHPHKNAQGASKDGYDDKLPELVPNATLGIYHTWSGTYVDFDGNRIAGPKR